MMTYIATAQGDSIGRVRYQLLEVTFKDYHNSYISFMFNILF